MRWPWLRLAAAVAALAVGAHAYRLNVLAPADWWYVGARELFVAMVLLVLALRRRDVPDESGLRRWTRRALGIVAVALFVVAVDQGGRPGHELGAVLATFAALASFFVFRWLPFRAEDARFLSGAPLAAKPSPGFYSWLLVGMAVTAAVVAAAINLSNHLAGLILWLPSLALLPLAVRRFNRDGPPHPPCGWTRDGGPQLSRSTERMALVSIFAVGAALRLPLLDRFPSFINSDEARLGRYAEQLWTEGFPNVFGLGWNAFPHLSVLLDHVPIQILGMDITHLRLASALFGLASLLATYFWARRWWGNVIAALATLILAVNLQHITWSRTGLNNIQQIFVGALMLATFARALQTRRLVDWVWFGYATGLTFHVYHAAKFFPAIFAAAALVYALGMRGFVRSNLLGGTVAAVSFLFMLGPQLVTIYLEWSWFYHNLSNRVDLHLLFEAHNAGNIEAVRNYISSHVISTLQLFTRDEWPFLDPYTSVPALVGVGWICWRWRDPRHVVVLLWVGGILSIGGMITAYPPNIPRLIGVLPVTCLIPAVVAGRVRGLLHECLPLRADIVAVPLLALWLSAAAYTSWRDVFVEMPRRQGTDPMTSMCRIIGRTPPPATLYTLGSAGEIDTRAAQYDCMMRLDVDRRNVTRANDPALIPVVPQNHGAAVFFFTRQQAALVPLALHYYPTALYDFIENYERDPQLWAVTLTPEDINRQRGLRTTLHDGLQAHTVAVGLDIIACRDCGRFPVDVTAEGLVLAAEPGLYSFRSTKGTVELDGRPVADEELRLYAGWHHLVLRTTLEGASDRVLVEWKTPGDPTWRRVRREMLNTHPKRHGLLGRYYERQLPLDPAQPSADVPDYTHLDAALSFDWNTDLDPQPLPSFAGKPSTMEWIGFVDLPEGETQILRLNTTAAARVFLDGRLVLASPGGGSDTSNEVTLSGLRGRVPILVRTTRPADDPTYNWWFRLEWQPLSGNWTTFVDYRPPAD